MGGGEHGETHGQASCVSTSISTSMKIPSDVDIDVGQWGTFVYVILPTEDGRVCHAFRA